MTYKNIKIKEEIYNQLKFLALQEGTTINQIIIKLLTEKTIETQETKGNINCIYNYYTYQDGEKIYTCPIRKINPNIEIEKLAKIYCKNCVRKQVVFEIFRKKLSKKAGKDLKKLYTVEMRPRADGDGYYKVYICNLCQEEKYSKKDIEQHIKEWHY